MGFFFPFFDAGALLIQLVLDIAQVRDLLLLQVFEMLNFNKHGRLLLTLHFYEVIQLLPGSLGFGLQACDRLFKSGLFSLLFIDLLLGRGQLATPQLLELGEDCDVGGDVVVAVAWNIYFG